MAPTLDKAKKAAVFVAFTVGWYFAFLYVEAWTIKTLCREIIRCALP